MRGPLLVLGVGNILMGDDGAGVHAVRALAGAPESRTGLPPGSDVVDGGTAGLSLLPLISRAGALVLVDAVDVGDRPGTVHVLTGPALGGGSLPLSVHQAGACDLLAAARLVGALPGEVALVGVQVACLDPGLRLSPPVRAALPEMIRAVRARARRASARTRRTLIDGTRTDDDIRYDVVGESQRGN